MDALVKALVEQLILPVLLPKLAKLLSGKDEDALKLLHELKEEPKTPEEQKVTNEKIQSLISRL